jgi:hypothetical protein
MRINEDTGQYEHRHFLSDAHHFRSRHDGKSALGALFGTSCPEVS